MLRKASLSLLSIYLLVIFATPAFAWKFVSMADSRGSNNGVNTTVLTQIVNLVKAENVDLVIFQGDAVNGSSTDSTLASQMDTWLGIMNTLNCPWYFAVGNHEIAASTSEAVIRSKVNMPMNGPVGDEEVVYSFDHQNAHFVALNSNNYGQSHHVQRSWLTTDLAGTIQPHVFVMAHEPAYPVDGHIGSSLDYYPSERDDFWNIMSAKGVRMYFTGHEHLYSRTQQGSIIQVINGSCGAPLYTAPPGAISTYHYVLVEVNGLNVTCQAKNSSGTVIDTWSYSVPPSNDTEPPTVPQNLRSTGATASSISLAWNASTDNYAVAGYRVYRNGAPVGTTSSLTYTDAGLALGTTYTYEVEAYDATPNYSAKSASIQAATSSVVAEIIIESRSGGQNYGSYSEVGTFANGSPTSSATGCTPGIGFRYSSTTYAGRYANYTFSPAIGLVPGTYNIYATWGKYTSDPAKGASAIKYDFDGVFTGTSHNQSVNWNTWQQVGGTTGLLTASNHVVKQYYDGTESSKWLIANAMKMVLVQQAFMLNLTPSPSAGGTCGGSGYKLPGATSVSASANTGWAFSKWSNNSAGTDTVSTANPYSYLMPASDRNLYAIFNDTAAPSGTIVINGSAQYTNSDIVTLTLSASDPYSGTGVSEMQFSNDGVNWSVPEVFATSKGYMLSSGDGMKTVYVKFRDAAGNWSSPVSDSITLDTLAPTIGIGAPSAASTAVGPVTHEITYGGANAVTLVVGNVTLNKTGTADGTVVVSGTGLTTRTVTISNITGNGTLGISIAAGTATDPAGNTAPAAGPSAVFNVINDLQSFALINKAVADEIMVDAAGNFVFTVFGKVTPIDANSFSVDDGSSMPVTVIFAGHGFTSVDYVSATGTLNVSGEVPILTAQVVKKLN